PAHLGQPLRLGGLFALDGAAFLLAAVASARGARWWRGPTVALLLATILAYLLIVISGREAVDDLGIATKLVELTALGLVLWRRAGGAAWRWSVVAATLTVTIVVSGGAAWAATLRAGAAGQEHTPNGARVIAAAEPTQEQRVAA